jgi:hypothetical protein
MQGFMAKISSESKLKSLVEAEIERRLEDPKEIVQMQSLINILELMSKTKNEGAIGILNILKESQKININLGQKTNEKDSPKDLRAKGLYMAGLLLEMAGKAKKGKGIELALKTLISGKALKKMNEIIDLQGRKVKNYHEIKLGTFTYNVLAQKDERIKMINNILLSKIASIAGAPGDKGAGIYLFKHVKDKVKKGEALFKIYCESKDRLKEARRFLTENEVFEY